MTDLLPETARATVVIDEPDPACEATYHAATHSAWQRGCRCPAAVDAHDEFRVRRRAKNKHQPAAVDEDGNCVAAWHGMSELAWKRGCRCAGSIADHERHLAVIRARHRRKSDPRKPWRGPEQRVNALHLWMLVRGLRDEPTYGEELAAVYILMRRGNRAGTGIMQTKEIAERIGVSDTKVRSLKETIQNRRASRTNRRRADAQWKQIQREKAIEQGRGHDRSGHKARGQA